MVTHDVGYALTARAKYCLYLDGDHPVYVTSAHWLRGVERVSSPNEDARPDAGAIELVVLHGISLPPGQFGTGMVRELFCNELDCSRSSELADLEGVFVSAHALVERDGRITQFVPFNRRAWHAGQSSFRGRSRCNDFAIGIELEGTDVQPYAAEQYAALSEILLALFRRYPRLDPSVVVGHCDIAPGRKTDPGPAFDWPRLLASLDA
ncbi:MAG: 1,6-anhydro-N-acetylmuramyl-L-alanine amidase AmpD [Pseudomonadaceae bacterium]|nr:1,6-anhydro-N-acetylmuramyl-L-alanine amidase AmpD [Pseudomonadaceae bacterium]